MRRDDGLDPFPRPGDLLECSDDDVVVDFRRGPDDGLRRLLRFSEVVRPVTGPCGSGVDSEDVWGRFCVDSVVRLRP